MRALGRSRSVAQNRHIQTAADAQTHPMVQGDGRRVVGKHVQERRLAARRDHTGDGTQERLSVTTAAVRSRLRIASRCSRRNFAAWAIIPPLNIGVYAPI